MLLAPTQALQRLNSPTLQAASHYVQSLPASNAVARAQALAQIVAGLDAEDEVVLGALLFPLLAANVLGEDQAVTVFGSEAARIARESMRVASFGTSAPLADGRHTTQQAENLRKMLLAIVTDPRLVLIRLADQLHRLRESKKVAEVERRRIAMETREIYAPLANRLGIWQLKWELEDLSFRYLNPDEYKEIAQLLASKRVDREQYIDNVMREIREALSGAGFQAQVAG
ncbi:MAG TPA: HD domain-containing protein, partial [Steroidobacteraceae bacterium]|nr:HD domain-containing protein [Steroidobacteraceae bacterium]